jgi:hypothetical protein
MVDTSTASKLNEIVVGQSPSGKNLSTEARDIVGIRHQATTGANTAG